MRVPGRERGNEETHATPLGTARPVFFSSETPVALSTRWSCPQGGALHQVELSTWWSYPPGGAIHQVELSTRRSCPPGGAVHQVELSTRRSCPPGGAVHLFTRVE
ncbi:unnamed protein product [Lampetra fluviatilis]